NRVLGLEGNVSADAPRSPAQAPKEELPEAEAIPDTDPGRGGPASEEPPLVVGHALIEEVIDNRLIKTEIDPSRPDGPPVVMGRPRRAPPPARAWDHAPPEHAARPGGPPGGRGQPVREPPAVAPAPAPAPPPLPPLPPRPNLGARPVLPESRPSQPPT